MSKLWTIYNIHSLAMTYITVIAIGAICLPKYKRPKWDWLIGQTYQISVYVDGHLVDDLHLCLPTIHLAVFAGPQEDRVLGNLLEVCPDRRETQPLRRCLLCSNGLSHPFHQRLAHFSILGGQFQKEQHHELRSACSVFDITVPGCGWGPRHPFQVRQKSFVWKE